MQILRNRELCRMLAVMLAVMAAGSVAGFCFDWRAGCLAFLVGLLVAICAIGFAGRQYRRLRRLSACLSASAQAIIRLMYEITTRAS